MANPSDIIVPGQAGVPVDPNDPTKGMMMPVFNAQQLTAAVLELRQIVTSLAMTQNAITSETADALEALSIVVLDMDGAGEQVVAGGFPEEAVKGSIEKLATFARDRSEARREVEKAIREAQEAQGIDPAFAGPEATPPVVPDPNPANPDES